MDVTKISEKIKSGRKDRGMTQKDLAQAMNVSNQLVSKWETGESIPSVEYLMQLSEVLRVEIGYFLNAEETESEASVAPPVAPLPTDPAPKAAKRSKRPFNFKVFFISLGSALGAALIVAMCLMTYFVFIPHANRSRYIDKIETCIDTNLQLGYYNIKYTTEVDGDVKQEDYLQGYIDENGEVVFYNSDDDVTVKSGISSTSYSYTEYIQPADIVTLEDLLERQLDAYAEDAEDADDFDLDKIKYIRKKGNGYYLEMKDSFFTDELTGTEKKNLKLLATIKGNVVLDGEYFRSMSVTVKFRNKPDRENFTVKTTMEMIREKPMITHGDLSSKSYYANLETYPICNNLVDADGFVAQMYSGARRLTVSDEIDGAVKNGKVRYENGTLYAFTDDTLRVLNPNDFSVTRTVKLENADFDSLYVYNGRAFWKENSYSAKTLYRTELTTGVRSVLFEGQYALNTPCYSGKYVLFREINAYVYDLQKLSEHFSTIEYLNYVDAKGRGYCMMFQNSTIYFSDGTSKSISGDRIYKEENGYVYTKDDTYIYKYDGATLAERYSVSDKKFQSAYRKLGDGYCMVGESAIYDADGSLENSFGNVRLLAATGDSYDSFTNDKEYYDEITVCEVMNDYVIATFGLFPRYVGVYAKNDLSVPLCHMEYGDRFNSYFAVYPMGDLQWIVVNVSGNYSYYVC